MLLGRGLFAVAAVAAAHPLADVPRIAAETVAETMTIRVHHGWAEGTMRASLRDTEGNEAGEGQVSVSAGPGAVFVGLRSYAPAVSGVAAAVWSAELLTADAAQARYDKSSVSGPAPMDSVLMRWDGVGQADLRVYPLLPGVDKTIEYDVLMPTTYAKGVDVATLPPAASENAPGTGIAALWPADLNDELTLDGRIVPAGTRIVLSEAHQVGVRRLSAPPLDGTLASIALPTGRTLERMRITAAPRMGEAPRGAEIVIALDTSRSNTDLHAMSLAARAYLAQMPESVVLLVTFDRHARAVTSGFVPAARAIDVLGSLRVETKNGSELGEALALADVRLAAEKPGPRRVLVLTDFRTRESLHPNELPPMRSGAVVHIADVGLGTPSVSRDDESPWAPAARATGGVVWHATASRQALDRSAMSATFEEWARPTRIDRVRVTSTPALVDLGVQESFAEGESFDNLGFSKAAHGSYTIEGEVWSRPFRVSVAADAREGDRWSALVLGDATHGALEEAEVKALAFRGHALSSQTSFVSAAAGLRPPDEGTGMGTSSGGTFDGGSGVGRGRVTRGFGSIDLTPLLRMLLLPGWHSCGGKDTAAKITLETTRLEVVDVVKIETSSPLRAACMREAAWDIVLPADFEKISRTFDVDL